MILLAAIVVCVVALVLAAVVVLLPSKPANALPHVVVPPPFPNVPSQPPKEPTTKEPTTVDAVTAWEIVRDRLATNGLEADDLAELDTTIAPKLFNAPKPKK